MKTAELSKRTLAEVFALSVRMGHWNYFDKCEWIPALHKYRYYSADEEKVYYMSQSQMVENFRDYCDEEEQEEMINYYFDTVNTMKEYQRSFTNGDGHEIKVVIKSSREIRQGQFKDLYELLTTSCRWYIDQCSGKTWGLINLNDRASTRELTLNELCLKDDVYGENDVLLQATIYCEVC